MKIITREFTQKIVKCYNIIYRTGIFLKNILQGDAMNMNIRKIIMSATAAVMTLSTATCFAMIPITELNIGGVYLEMPLSEVVNRFGQPINKAQTPPKGYYNYTFQNGNSTFSVTPKGFDSDSII